MLAAAEAVVRGPVTDVALLDATWQDQPTWTDDAAWVTEHPPGLAYDGPPFPGLLVRANVPPEAVLRISYGEETPGAPLERVHSTELILGDHGFVIETDSANFTVPMLAGNYNVEVWVHAVAQTSARAVAFVFGPRRPRNLGRPRPG